MWDKFTHWFNEYSLTAHLFQTLEQQLVHVCTQAGDILENVHGEQFLVLKVDSKITWLNPKHPVAAIKLEVWNMTTGLKQELNFKHYDDMMAKTRAKHFSPKKTLKRQVIFGFVNAVHPEQQNRLMALYADYRDQERDEDGKPLAKF